MIHSHQYKLREFREISASFEPETVSSPRVMPGGLSIFSPGNSFDVNYQ